MEATVTLYYKSPEPDCRGQTPRFRYSAQIEGLGWGEVFSPIGNYELYKPFTIACRQSPLKETFLVDLAIPQNAAATSRYIETLKL